MPGLKEHGFFDSLLLLVEHRKAFLFSPFVWAVFIGLLYRFGPLELKKALEFIFLLPKK